MTDATAPSDMPASGDAPVRLRLPAPVADYARQVWEKITARAPAGVAGVCDECLEPTGDESTLCTRCFAQGW